MATAVFPQPDGRRYRRLPLVHSWRTEPALSARSRTKRVGRCFLPMVRHSPLPKNRKELCRPDLTLYPLAMLKHCRSRTPFAIGREVLTYEIAALARQMFQEI